MSRQSKKKKTTVAESRCDSSKFAQFLQNHLGTEYGYLLSIIAYSAIIVMISSLDSPLYALWGRYDSAWFFTCGKALMNGMLPYIEFSDSKGPMLWLIYGIAYFISPHSYFGICFPTIVSMSATLIIIYKLSRIYVAPKPSLLIAFALGVGLFNIVHYEVRAEDFCQPFVACVIYASVRILHNSSNRRLAILAGISIGTAILIKYSTAAMICFPLFFTLVIIAIRGRLRDAWQTSLWVMAGCIGAMIPMLSYLALRGCLPAMWNEYFTNTMLTVSAKGTTSPIGNYMKDLKYVWDHQTKHVITGVIMILCSLPLCFKDRRLSFVPLLSVVCIGAMSIMHFHSYYMSPMICYIAFALIFIAIILPRLNNIRWWAIALLTMVMIWGAPQSTLKTTEGFNGLPESTKYHIWSRMNQCLVDNAPSEHPTIVYTGGDIGIGLLSDALPGCRYWATQEGDTKEMRELKIEEIRTNRPDFIVTQLGGGAFSITKKIDRMGYKKIFDEKEYKIYMRVAREE